MIILIYSLLINIILNKIFEYTAGSKVKYMFYSVCLLKIKTFFHILTVIITTFCIVRYYARDFDSVLIRFKIITSVI